MYIQLTFAIFLEACFTADHFESRSAYWFWGVNDDNENDHEIAFTALMAKAGVL
ncbi:MAG: hypothetical protein HC889_00765 [Synechococcaceae cyanobacterium SM1_2_3]|nr:hypothetical protein [Synechococcaceae cyanobacterium SM1_2_3]